MPFTFHLCLTILWKWKAGGHGLSKKVPEGMPAQYAYHRLSLCTQACLPLPLKEEHVHLQGRIEICCRVVQYMLRPDN